MSAPQEKKFLHAILSAGAEHDALQSLLYAFGSFEAAWRAPLANADINRELAERLESIREHLNPDEEMRRLVAEGIALITADDPEFPIELHNISAAPIALYIKGRVSIDV